MITKSSPAEKKIKNKHGTQRLIKKQMYNGHTNRFISSQFEQMQKCQGNIYEAPGWTALKIKQSKNVQQTKPADLGWRGV